MAVGLAVKAVEVLAALVGAEGLALVTDDIKDRAADRRWVADLGAQVDPLVRAIRQRAVTERFRVPALQEWLRQPEVRSALAQPTPAPIRACSEALGRAWSYGYVALSPAEASIAAEYIHVAILAACVPPAERDRIEVVRKLNELGAHAADDREVNLVSLDFSEEILRRVCSLQESVGELSMRPIETDNSTKGPLLAPPYVASHALHGRTSELNELDHWFASTSCLALLEGIGGNGKSALAWSWVHRKIAAEDIRADKLVWWSFYDGTISTSAFLRETCSHIEGVTLEDLVDLEDSAVLRRLTRSLQQEQHLLVLDGLERLLVAYHQTEPYRILDEGVDATLRSFVDPLDADVLRALSNVGASRVLVTSRLIPQGWPALGQNVDGSPQLIPVSGLEPDDAFDLAKSLGLRADKDLVVSFFSEFEFHPLAIGVIGGLVCRYRPAPGNLKAWLADPDAGGRLNLSELPLINRRHKILEHALGLLTGDDEAALASIALFGKEITYDTLCGIDPFLSPLGAGPSIPEPERGPSIDEWAQMRRELGMKRNDIGALVRFQELVMEKRRKLEFQVADLHRDELTEYLGSRSDASSRLNKSLQNLEDLGLLSWDRQRNVYDLHAVVRGTVFDATEAGVSVSVYERIRDHFVALPKEDTSKARTLRDLDVTITLAKSLIGSVRLEEAASLLESSLGIPLLFRVCHYPTLVELWSGLLVSIERDGERWPDLLNSFGIAKGQLREYEQARTAFETRIRVEVDKKSPLPLMLAILLDNACALYRADHSDRMYELSEQLADLSGDPSLRTSRIFSAALRRYEQGRLDDVVSLLDEFRSEPTPHIGYYRIGSLEVLECQLALRSGTLTADQIVEARSTCEDESNRSGVARALAVHSQLLESQGELDRALEVSLSALDIALSMGKSGDEHRTRTAELYLALDLHDEAKAMLAANREASFRQSDVLQRMGDLDGAKQCALTALLDWRTTEGERSAIIARYAEFSQMQPPEGPEFAMLGSCELAVRSLKRITGE